MTKNVCGFDVGFLKELKDLMKETNIEELEIEEGSSRYIKVSKKNDRNYPPYMAQFNAPYGYNISDNTPQLSPVNAANNQPSQNTAAPVNENPYADESKYFKIKSPVIGTFYGTPSPDSPPYVKAGDTVSPDTTVCIVEAMKVMNEIKADVQGKIIEILKSNGNPVQTNEPLFIVEKR
jgi:acetyl-CoA carboxylase biotin carboxyl carrier protein